MILSRGKCSVCGRSVALKADGKIRAHRQRANSRLLRYHCEGTARPPVPPERRPE